MDPAADTVPGFEDDDRRTLGFEIASRREAGKPGSEHDDLRAAQRSRWTRFPRHSRSIHGGNMRLRPHSRHELPPASDVVVECLRCGGPRAGGAHVARC